MRYLIISDIHSNLHALDAVLKEAKTVGYDQVIVLGDLVGYGGDPEAVIDRTLALEPVAIIRGNHDKVAAGIEPSSLFNDAARVSIEWTAKVLPPSHLRLLKNLAKGPLTVTKDIEICHGAPFDEDYYIFDADDALKALQIATAPLCLYGHTHVPAAFSTSGDAPPTTTASEENVDKLKIADAGRTIINVGSVGQPRDGDSRAAYGVYDVESRVMEFRRVRYDVVGAQSRITDAGMPPWLALRLMRGQ